MKIFRLGMVASCVLALTACPPADRPVGDPAVTPATPAAETPATAPRTDIPATAQRIELEPAAAATPTPTGATAAGEIHVEPRDGAVGVWVTLRNGFPNESHGVRVMSGTCENPGVEIGRIDAVNTDAAGFGQSATELGAAPHQIMDGNHFVGVYAPGADAERDRPIACATLAQNGAVRM